VLVDIVSSSGYAIMGLVFLRLLKAPYVLGAREPLIELMVQGIWK